MKHQFLKKLAVFALAVGMLLPVAAPTVQAKAEKKKEVWVLDTKNKFDFAEFKYKYNKNGLLTEEKCLKGDGEASTKYTYKGTKISKSFQAVRTSASDAGEYDGTGTKYTYDKKGHLIKAGDYANYTWKNGRIITDGLCFFFYDKNGWITKIGGGESIDNLYSECLFEYDKHGYKISESPEEGLVYPFVNKYKGGRLARASHAEMNGDEYSPTTYKYKKIKVPASRVKQVKRQQDWLTNKGNMQLLPLAAY